MSEKMIDMDAATWALCPFIRRDRGKCRKCPMQVETKYGPGTALCRSWAEDAARAVVDAIKP